MIIKLIIEPEEIRRYMVDHMARVDLQQLLTRLPSQPSGKPVLIRPPIQLSAPHPAER